MFAVHRRAFSASTAHSGKERQVRQTAGHAAFTLVELLVSMALLALIMVLLAVMTSSTANTWRYTAGRIEQFKGASNAFDAMTRKVAQATLNTSWDYHYPGNDPSKQPDRYVRESTLRFLCGKTDALVKTSSPRRPTQGIFFHAPLGYVDDPQDFGGLDNLLNTWGYYVEFNKDNRPAFLDSIPNPPMSRYRYRLMELMEPSNDLSIYTKSSGDDTYAGHEWFTDALSAAPAPVHVLAENVVALVLLPKLSKTEDPSGVKLAPNYTYDSTVTNPNDPSLDSKNQLPPVVQVTLVAIDDASAGRIAKGANVPAFDAELDNLFLDATRFDDDLQTLQTTLATQHISYRVFTSNVSLRGAKWSRK